MSSCVKTRPLICAGAEHGPMEFTFKHAVAMHGSAGGVATLPWLKGKSGLGTGYRSTRARQWDSMEWDTERDAVDV